MRAAEALLDASACVHGCAHAGSAPPQPPAAVLAQVAADGSSDCGSGAGSEVPQSQQAPPLPLSAWAWDAGDAVPIIAAARRGHTAMVRLLASRGADVDSTLPDGRSLLLALVDGVPVPISAASAESTAEAGGGAGAVSQPPCFKGSRVRYGMVEALLELGADPHALSMERAAAARGRRDSFVTRRTAATTVRASGDARLQAIFEGAAAATAANVLDVDARNGSMIAGGEP